MYQNAYSAWFCMAELEVVLKKKKSTPTTYNLYTK